MVGVVILGMDLLVLLEVLGPLEGLLADLACETRRKASLANRLFGKSVWERMRGKENENAPRTSEA